MQALVVVDAQNEFSTAGLRPVPGHAEALDALRRRVVDARAGGDPIAWVRHHNRPDEPPGFAPDTWGAELSPGLGPDPGRAAEVELTKDVVGAFTGTDLGAWLEAVGADGILLVGFMAHQCVSTTAREAVMRGLRVAVDPDATGAVAIAHPLLGRADADEVRRTALLHLAAMGVEITPHPDRAATARPLDLESA